MSFAVEGVGHEGNAEEGHPQPDQHERDAVTRQEGRRGGQAEDGQDVGDVMNAAGDHGQARGRAAGAGEGGGGGGALNWHEQAEAQDAVERGLNAEADDDGEDDPAVLPEQAGGILETLRPGDDAEINASQQGRAGQAGGERDQDASFHALMVSPGREAVIRKQARNNISKIAYEGMGVYALCEAAQQG